MRKIKWLSFIAVLTLGLVTACDKDESEPDSAPVQDETIELPETQENLLEDKFFSIEGATFSEGDFPQSTINEEIQGLNVNSKALTGGMNFVTIVSETEYEKFYIGIKDVPGYYIYEPEKDSTRASISGSISGVVYIYTIPITYSIQYSVDITMLISGVKITGDITKVIETRIKHIESESGELNVNLTFSNEKDIDLHMFTPSGKEIYYGNRGGSISLESGDTTITVTYGLDHDSNAACRIDSLNNENIYIPAELIEPGIYKIIVNMYSNCNPNIATSWSVIVRHKGNVVPVLTGSNPASGIYPIGAYSGDRSVVMTFEIENETETRAMKIKPETFKAIPQSIIDKIKMEESNY